MAPIMEGTHTVLCLYPPIREFSNISLYFPKRRDRSFSYKNHAPHSERASKDHDWGKDDLPGPKQRGQSSYSSGRLLNSQQATKEAVAELCWLAAEHHQLLVELLSLCKVCANKVKMGNQDGKLQEHMEDQEVYLRGQVHRSSCSLPVPPERKRTTSKSRRMKKMGVKKPDSAEDLLHNKIKKKVLSGVSSAEHPAINSDFTSADKVVDGIPGFPPSVNVSDRSVTAVKAVTNPILPMEEPLQVAREGWDLMVDNPTFDPDMDFCNDFSEYDGELGYESSFCSLMEGLNRRESGSNLRPSKRYDSLDGMLSENVVRPAQQLCSEQSNLGVGVLAKGPDVGRAQHVGRTSPDRAAPVVLYPLMSNREETDNKLSEGLRLPLLHTNEPYPQTKAHTKSPSSPSLAVVFNKSFPASNSLQSMSPVLSPLSSKQASPQLNHRIVLLSDKDVDHGHDSSSNTDEPRLFTEVIDKNGNKQTLTRLDLNLSRRPSTTKWNSSSNSTTTGGLLEIPLHRL